MCICAVISFWFSVPKTELWYFIFYQQLNLSPQQKQTQKTKQNKLSIFKYSSLLRFDTIFLLENFQGFFKLQICT